MTVTVYSSKDASAPVMTGVSGSLVAVLDACLVNGYGTKSGAGWTIAYTGTNERVYKMSPTAGTGNSLFVNDAGPSVPNEAEMTGFEAPTGLGTGSGQFPTAPQISIGIGAVVCRKSATNDATIRNWTLIADNTCFYLFVETGDFAAPLATMPFVFGDIFSYKTSDPYRTVIIGRSATNNNSNSFENFGVLAGVSYSPLAITFGGHFMDRHWSGVGGSIPVGKHIEQTKLSGTIYGQGGAGYSGTNPIPLNNSPVVGIGGISPGFVTFNYPNGPDGGLYLSPIWIHHSGAVRGYLKGLWSPVQPTPLNHNDTYSGTGNLAGKSFLSQSITIGSNSAWQNSFIGQVHIETSSTWS
jgi:hypothetical protein